MAGLFYRDDMDDVRARLAAWWNGEDIGRPVLLLTVPREKPLEEVPCMPEPRGWVTHYSTSNFEYRVNLAARRCVNTHYLGEAVPTVAPDLAPNCLALYLGCKGIEMPGTVWCAPCMASPDEARFEVDEDNFYWQFTLRLGREMLRMAPGKFLVEFPDLIEGLDTLAAMRGTEELLTDLVERPDWVHACLRPITDRYFDYYDPLYAQFRDEVGGSVFWMWAPGRMTKLQCDFSAMISPSMFDEFMVPILREMTERVDYSMYHWDGPAALRHHDHLLSLPRLNMLQWTPGDGVELPGHRRWWPYFHKTIDAGKKIFLAGGVAPDELDGLRREFGPKLNQFAIQMSLPSLQEARDTLERASG
ncbi:MAG TPA: hypothetical protein PLO37_20475 [Candidatus Hydrogenedentes bacterium]|nr:hypothetical protein [Candidatus Hydrogenedentota bacterium]HPG69231.1 hypothetical protein [Candidatus Hydrogenedentota bacterium]